MCLPGKGSEALRLERWVSHRGTRPGFHCQGRPTHQRCTLQRLFWKPWARPVGDEAFGREMAVPVGTGGRGLNPWGRSDCLWEAGEMEQEGKEASPLAQGSEWTALSSSGRERTVVAE